MNKVTKTDDDNTTTTTNDGFKLFNDLQYITGNIEQYCFSSYHQHTTVF